MNICTYEFMHKLGEFGGWGQTFLDSSGRKTFLDSSGGQNIFGIICGWGEGGGDCVTLLNY